MLNLKIAIIWGSALREIKDLLDATDELYLGLFIHSLRNLDDSKSKAEKAKYLASLKIQIDKINKVIRTFNSIRYYGFQNKYKLKKLPIISFGEIRKIINEHNDKFPKDKDVSFIDDLFAQTDTASSIARKHTILRLRNVLLPVRISLGDFVKSLDFYKEPYEFYFSRKDRKNTILKEEILKSQACYSFGLDGEAVFILGRALENLSSKLLNVSKKYKPQLKSVVTKDVDFETKLNLLFHKAKIISPNDYSKAMSLKWDRNEFGHKSLIINKLTRPTDAIIKLAIGLLVVFENKIKTS